jgi:hypothetical protein
MSSKLWQWEQIQGYCGSSKSCPKEEKYLTPAHFMAENEPEGAMLTNKKTHSLILRSPMTTINRRYFREQLALLMKELLYKLGWDQSK